MKFQITIDVTTQDNSKITKDMIEHIQNEVETLLESGDGLSSFSDPDVEDGEDIEFDLNVIRIAPV